MIFTLTTVKNFFSEEVKPIYEKMGFVFKKNPFSNERENEFVIDENKLPQLVFTDIDAFKKWADIFWDDDIIINFERSEIILFDDYV